MGDCMDDDWVGLVQQTFNVEADTYDTEPVVTAVVPERWNRRKKKFKEDVCLPGMEPLRQTDPT